MIQKGKRDRNES